MVHASARASGASEGEAADETPPPCSALAAAARAGFAARVHLGMGDDLLAHADDMLADPHVTPVQLRFLAARLAEALREVCRIAAER